jgi:hypothetical protein
MQIYEIILKFTPIVKNSVFSDLNQGFLKVFLKFERIILSNGNKMILCSTVYLTNQFARSMQIFLQLIVLQ